MNSPEQLVRDWWRAWAEKDLGSLLSIAREDYVEFTGHSEQHRDGRSLLATVAEQAFAAVTIRSWQVEDVIVRPLEGDAAVIAYRWSSEVDPGSGRQRRFGVATDVVSRQGDQWQYVAHHSSLLGTVEQPGSPEEAL